MDRITGVMMSLLTGQVCGGEPPLPALTADVLRSVTIAASGAECTFTVDGESDIAEAMFWLS